VCNSVNSYAAYRDSMALYNLAFGSTNCLEFNTNFFFLWMLQQLTNA
jgi:hypothetical protein